MCVGGTKIGVNVALFTPSVFVATGITGANVVGTKVAVGVLWFGFDVAVGVGVVVAVAVAVGAAVGVGDAFALTFSGASTVASSTEPRTMMSAAPLDAP